MTSKPPEPKAPLEGLTEVEVQQAAHKILEDLENKAKECKKAGSHREPIAMGYQGAALVDTICGYCLTTYTRPPTPKEIDDYQRAQKTPFTI